MKIVYDYQIFGAQKYGGISRYFSEIAKAIPVIGGHDIEIFSPLYINEYIRPSRTVRLRGLKIRHSRFSSLPTTLINASITRLFNYGKHGTDIFHETYYSSIDCAPRSAKRIVTVHDMIHEIFSNLFPRNDATRRAKLAAVRRADHIICVSENTRRDLLEVTDIPVEKTSVVYHGYSLINTNSKPAHPRRLTAPYLLYVGARDGYKNFEGLLSAYASSSLRNEFSIACFGGGNATPRESSLIQSLGINPKNVVFLSGGDETLSSLYTFASAFVYPSLYEGFGIPPLEAMSLGCPVVCSNSSSLPEVVGGAAELFDPKDIDCMRAALERVLLSADRSRRLVALGYQRVNFFSWEKCAQETLNVYKRVLRN